MSVTSVLLIGLDPEVVNYDRWLGLTAEKLQAGLQQDVAPLNESGYEAETCFVDHGQTAEEIVKRKLADSDFGCILSRIQTKKE
ncbi:MAG: hypothetical protein KJP16_08760 [Gammaproteobacteria bacterium]|nr:hypothetical protein [Gammaproteobacteria bacterium]NNL50895.1 hypothetical protein [Woeseiaceae bacterium]